jgi:peptidoglycan/LPS O-acetylase OafA/YrhL
MISSSKRNIGIDLARTIAITGVVLVHSGCLDSGRFGVQLFFLASGFLLADQKQLSNLQFLIRRAFRLFPLYLTVFVIFYIRDYETILQAVVSICLLQNALWLFNTFPGAWSISNEWIYSLLILPVQKLNRKKFLLLLGISWFFQFITSAFFYFTYPDPSQDGFNYELVTWLTTINPVINLVFLLIGIGLKNNIIPILKNKTIGLLIILLSQFISIYIGHDFMFMYPIVLWAIFSLCIQTQINSGFGQNLIHYIGLRTYGIFFMHFIVLRFIHSAVSEFQINPNLPITKIVIFLITFFISAIFANFTWKIIEKPTIIYSQKFIAKNRFKSCKE